MRLLRVKYWCSTFRSSEQWEFFTQVSSALQLISVQTWLEKDQNKVSNSSLYKSFYEIINVALKFEYVFTQDFTNKRYIEIRVSYTHIEEPALRMISSFQRLYSLVVFRDQNRDLDMLEWKAKTVLTVLSNSKIIGLFSTKVFSTNHGTEG